jgi:Bifunctional DNA primase/polymerase, N-terminal
MTANQEMLNSALAFAEAGFQVFALPHACKIPTKGSSGFYDATANAATIRRWFGGSFQRNLAIRTGTVSRCWVLDVDDAAALEAIEASHCCLPETRMSRSARGHHYWWRLGSTPVPTSTGRIAPGLDVRGEGGYVLAPPAVHPSGAVYEWVNCVPLVEAPAWLVERAVRQPVVPISQEAIARQRHPDGDGGASGD